MFPATSFRQQFLVASAPALFVVLWASGFAVARLSAGHVEPISFLALRFPSRGEASGVLMRALAAGRACVVSSGSTADEDLPEGVVARVNPGPEESRELGAVLELLLLEDAARLRMEQLSRAVASTRTVEPLTERLAGFLEVVAAERGEIESEIRARESQAATVRERFRVDLEAAASSLGLAHLPSNVLERLAGL